MSFAKLSSYDGLHSTGSIQTQMGITDGIKDRDIIIVEDIVDTGRTMFLDH